MDNYNLGFFVQNMLDSQDFATFPPNIHVSHFSCPSSIYIQKGKNAVL